MSGGRETHDEAEDNNIPRGVDIVHLPADVGQANWHDEDKHNPTKVVSIRGLARIEETYAKALRATDDMAMPFARIE
jgi:hypothetical protein